MDNQKLFMELLGDLMDYARANNNSISTTEIDDIFSDIELSSEQLEYIYDYMYTGGVTVRGYVGGSLYREDGRTADNILKADNTGRDTAEQSSNRLKQYRKNVRDIERVDEALLEEVCKRLLSGMADDKDKSILTERHLVTVLNIASKYTGNGVVPDELIQEGNLALVMGVDELAGSREDVISPDESAAALCEEFLRKRIRKGIIDHIDSVNEAESAMYAAIAKASLINEAVKTLATEYGRIATITELSQYTHIPVSEIRDIVRLSGDSIELGNE